MFFISENQQQDVPFANVASFCYAKVWIVAKYLDEFWSFLPWTEIFCRRLLLRIHFCRCRFCWLLMLLLLLLLLLLLMLSLLLLFFLRHKINHFIQKFFLNFRQFFFSQKVGIFWTRRDLDFFFVWLPFVSATSISIWKIRKKLLYSWFLHL